MLDTPEDGQMPEPLERAQFGQPCRVYNLQGVSES
jgi:hypothetical protein